MSWVVMDGVMRGKTMGTIRGGLTTMLGVLGLVLLAGTALAVERLAFSGGPEGGTFQYFSNGIAIRLSKNCSRCRRLEHRLGGFPRESATGEFR